MKLMTNEELINYAQSNSICELSEREKIFIRLVANKIRGDLKSCINLNEPPVFPEPRNIITNGKELAKALKDIRNRMKL